MDNVVGVKHPQSSTNISMKLRKVLLPEEVLRDWRESCHKTLAMGGRAMELREEGEF